MREAAARRPPDPSTRFLGLLSYRPTRWSTMR